MMMVMMYGRVHMNCGCVVSTAWLRKNMAEVVMFDGHKWLKLNPYQIKNVSCKHIKQKIVIWYSPFVKRFYSERVFLVGVKLSPPGTCNDFSTRCFCLCGSRSFFSKLCLCLLWIDDDNQLCSVNEMLACVASIWQRDLGTGVLSGGNNLLHTNPKTNQSINHQSFRSDSRILILLQYMYKKLSCQLFQLLTRLTLICRIFQRHARNLC